YWGEHVENYRRASPGLAAIRMRGSLDGCDSVWPGSDPGCTTYVGGLGRTSRGDAASRLPHPDRRHRQLQLPPDDWWKRTQPSLVWNRARRQLANQSVYRP